ncbi:hypothetical protein [Clostridium manihotivorum]|uniref:Uncharacterized protein n=1 Tax=Clostridium manihotivorum TaxID=2320868 RepID=A0A3R5R080_9CLOT|nr:hypothetical protein [Clostridium manihotivorum]QAA33613.1 hypothetical protein C1I91_19320 [Clostridium manihotivorum]
MADGTINIDESLLDIAMDMYKAQEKVKESIGFYDSGLKSFLGYYKGKSEALDNTYYEYWLKKLETLELLYGQACCFVNYCYEHLNEEDRVLAACDGNVI